MPFTIRQSNLVPQKRNVEGTPQKEPKRPIKAPTKPVVVPSTRIGDKDPERLLKGQIGSGWHFLLAAENLQGVDAVGHDP